MMIPPVLTLSKADAESYQDICDETGDPDFCNWVIRGFTIQGWLTFESILNNLVSHSKAVERTYQALVQIVKSRQKVMDAQQESIEGIGKPPPEEDP